jgi:hypothetical protein
MSKVISAGELEQNERIEQNIRDNSDENGLMTIDMDSDEFQDIFEDRDPFEFI